MKAIQVQFFALVVIIFVMGSANLSMQQRIIDRLEERVATPVATLAPSPTPTAQSPAVQTPRVAPTAASRRRTYPRPTPSRQRAFRSPTTSGADWAALAKCESGGNPRSVSSTGKYRGLYQFSFATWHSVGGVGDPIDASPSEQTYRASILLARSGRGQWPVCGRFL